MDYKLNPVHNLLRVQSPQIAYISKNGGEFNFIGLKYLIK
jgi:hypothetical protein